MAEVNHLHLGPLAQKPNVWARELSDENAWRDYVIAFSRAHGFNALGYDFPTPRPGFPYVWRVQSGARASAWMDEVEFPDVWAPNWEETCQRNAQRAANQVGDDPFLIGYFLDDCLEWPNFRAAKRRTGNWLETLQLLPPDAPGKRAWLQLMRGRYPNVAAFNAVHATRCADWDGVAALADWLERVPADPIRARADDEAFLQLVAARYYQTLCGAIRRHDQNHLILGEPFDGNRGILDAVLRAATPHLDVLGVQFYGLWKDQIADLERWHAQSGLPILLADSCFSCPGEEQPRPCGPRFATQFERARAFEIYYRAARACPFIVGWNWCGLVDSHVSIEPRRQHSGLLQSDGAPHRELCEMVRRCLSDESE